MQGALASFLSGLWARWISRAGNGHFVKVEQATIVAFQPEPPKAVEEPQPALVSVLTLPPFEAMEKSFKEMVGGKDALNAPRLIPTVADPQVRIDTLKALESLRQIPALQSLVQGVTRIMSRDGVDLGEVAEALQKDSALSVRVLSMANSAAIAPEMRIDDLQTALQMLGIARVRRVAQAVFTMRDAHKMADGLDWRHLWIHALATAAIAEELERRIRPSGTQQVYMAALLHDVGKIVLSTVAPDAYRDVIVGSWNGDGRLEDLERGVLGVDHREAGVIFAKANRLTEVVIQSIAHHDDPFQAESHRFEVALVTIANYISKSRGFGFSGARLDAADGELENLPAWKILDEEAGDRIDVSLLGSEMAGFYVTLRGDLRGMRESAA